MRDNSAVDLGRYAETALLPLRIEGRRLSDSYAAPKSGGAIAVIGKRAIIIDRLGELYSYDLTTLNFDRLKSPVLPKYLVSHSSPRNDQRGVNLDPTSANLEFRALDIAFLSDRRELAVYYEQLDTGDDTGRAVLAVIPFDATRFVVDGSWRQIFISESHPAHTYSPLGGRMAYDGNGALYLAIPDHSVPGSSQDPDTPLGKILKINLGTGRWHFFTSGHRNPEGLTFLKSGQLFSTEHGPRGGDELNVIVEGSNYGWPKVTLGTAYEDYDWNGATIVGRHAGYAAPLFAWVPSIGVSQLIELHDFHPRWNGDMLVASLKALSLFRLRLEAGRVFYSEPIWVGQRIRDLAQTGDGTIVLWTDDTQLLLVSVDTDQF